MKDVGGLVSDYQAQTTFYRISNREVRLHECRSACTLALSLPNVCVYPDSLLKFHLAYNERTKQSDYGVSQELFLSYPPAVRARLGVLTRNYKSLAGSELIKLGVRDCNEPHVPAPATPEPRIMLAKAVPRPVEGEISFGTMNFGTVWHNVMNVFGETPEQKTKGHDYAALSPRAVKPADLVPSEEQPLPPARPPELITKPAEESSAPPSPRQQDEILVVLDPNEAQGLLTNIPLPPPRPLSMQTAMVQKLAPVAWTKLIAGAQPILPKHFIVYARVSMR
jgi:hypothetical protein